MDKHSLIKTLSRFSQPDPTQRDTNFSAMRLSAQEAPLLLDILLDPPLPMGDGSDTWVSLYAWRALKSLGTPVDIASLLRTLELHQDSTWALDELPEVIATAGERAIAPTLAYIQSDADELVRGLAMSVLPLVVKAHPATREAVIEQLTTLLAHQTADTAELNGFLVLALIELKALDSLVVMHNAYQKGIVSEAVAGDWEDVEMSLGLRKERSQPRANDLYEGGDVEPPSQDPVPETISNDDLFDRLQQHLDYYGDEYSIQEVAGLDGLFAAVSCSPKMIMPTEWLAAIWGGEDYMPEFPSQAELTIFIELVMKLFNQTHQHVKETKQFKASFMSSVNEEGEQVLNVQSWCEGFMRGIVLGQPPLIDSNEIQQLLTPIALFGSPEGYKKAEHMTETEVNSWAKQIEPSVLKIRDWAALHAPKLKPIVNDSKVGRNDVCPCGSGKKYKKCCGA
jgi:uncharacterized protein